MHATVRDCCDGCVEESDIAQVHVKPAGLNLNPGIGPYFYNLENLTPPLSRKSGHAAQFYSKCTYSIDITIVMIF